ncbi:hypothetical protein [Tenacibaculum caenipelagi]|uniref:Uncharacterized protein n=1 Tax=Tenacibaculum caenipelagi TaxID=1325435 RepID=A0A4R6TFF5_9FLAO|nr:hypothetical protein [Tenacibaculum caenipelagi]TDQ25802.1 hypothetical protein DFQ07_2233 [Tenacibaculum caenipelagi]
MEATKDMTHEKLYQKTTGFGIITYINKKINEGEKNRIGISIILITVGSMIASITAALAVDGKVNLFALIFACVTAMGANAVAISQRSFKTIAWAFIINILGNIILIFYLLM